MLAYLIEENRVLRRQLRGRRRPIPKIANQMPVVRKRDRCAEFCPNGSLCSMGVLSFEATCYAPILTAKALSEEGLEIDD